MTDIQEIRNILRTMSAMEASFMEYSNKSQDYYKMQVYADYFNSNVMESKQLYQYYHPSKFSNESISD